jgi:protocatechuate 3,4-dioxygenase beta subunit
MRPQTVGLFAGLLVLLALAAWWLSSRLSDPERARLADARPPAHMDAGERTAQPEGSTERSDPLETVPPGEPAGPDREHDLHGRVVDSRGELVPGARIVVARNEAVEFPVFEDIEYLTGSREVARSETDASGEFRFRLPRGRPFTLEIEAAGFAPMRLPKRYAGEFVLVRLSVPGAVVGQVRREGDGAPVEGARVSAWVPGATPPAPATETDAAGFYRFERLALGVYFLYVVPEVESPPPLISFSVGEGQVTQQDVTVQEGRTLRGRVTDVRSGEPIEGALVGAGLSPAKSVRSDAGGEYRLTGVPADRALRVEVRAAGYGKAEGRIDSEQERDPVADFALDPGRRAKGRIVDAGGGPVPGAYVSAVACEFEGLGYETDWIAARSASDGTFELVDLRRDLRHRLHAYKEDHARVLVPFPSREDEVDVVDLGDVVLPPPCTIGGQVVDDTARGLPEVDVTVTGESSTPSVRDFLAQRTGRSDDLGRFRFTDLSPGEYRVKASAWGRPEEAELTVRIASGETREGIVLILRAGLTISGRVLDSSGRPVSFAGLMLLREGHARSASQVIDGDGSFRFAGLAEGRYTLRAEWCFQPGAGRAERLAPATLSGIEAGSSGVTVVLPRSLPVSGTVVEADGTPAAHAFVIAVPEVEGALHVDLVHAGEDGRFTLHVPEGSLIRLHAGPTRPDEGSLWGRAAVGSRESRVSQGGIVPGARDIVLRLPARR